MQEECGCQLAQIFEKFANLKRGGSATADRLRLRSGIVANEDRAS